MVKDNKHFNTYKEGLDLEFLRALDLLTREGYDSEFGACPVKRAIQRLLLNDLSRAILAGTVNRDHPIRVDAAADHLTFS